MTEDTTNTESGQPDSAEDDESAELSEELPEEVGGEEATPLGSSDEHSEAPGPHGLGPVSDSGEEESPGLAPLEDESES